MNILLVYPEYPASLYSFYKTLDYVSKKSVSPPLGLLTVAAMLPKGWNKKLVDCNIIDLLDEDIKWAGMVFISGIGIHQENILPIIKRLKEFGKTIVAGGTLFSDFYEIDGTNKIYKDIDHLVLDEAEVTLPLFLADLEKGVPKKVYASKVRPDISKTPPPLWELADTSKYIQMTIQYSRGCPFNCDFCDIVIHFGHTPRLKTPEQMLIEFQALYDTGWRGAVFIVDDNFIGNKREVKKLLPHIIEWQKKYSYPFTLSTQASINLSDDDELMNLMMEANFVSILIGFESTSIESLLECGKFQNTNRNLLDSVKTIYQKGIEIAGGFIVGFDSDTESIFDSQIDFIQESGVIMLILNILNIPPHTKLWHKLKAEGRLLSESTGDSTDGSIQFISKMGNKKLLNGFLAIISTLFSPDAYYKRVERFIELIKPNTRSGFNKGEISAFFKSIWRIGFLSYYKLKYWRLLIKTLFINPKAFTIAVKSAIVGEDYFSYKDRVLEKHTLY